MLAGYKSSCRLDHQDVAFQAKTIPFCRCGVFTSLAMSVQDLADRGRAPELAKARSIIRCLLVANSKTLCCTVGLGSPLGGTASIYRCCYPSSYSSALYRFGNELQSSYDCTHGLRSIINRLQWMSILRLAVKSRIDRDTIPLPSQVGIWEVLGQNMHAC